MRVENLCLRYLVDVTTGGVTVLDVVTVWVVVALLDVNTVVVRGGMLKQEHALEMADAGKALR